VRRGRVPRALRGGAVASPLRRLLTQTHAPGEPANGRYRGQEGRSTTVSCGARVLIGASFPQYIIAIAIRAPRHGHVLERISAELIKASVLAGGTGASAFSPPSSSR
jgi:hypothetical protein